MNRSAWCIKMLKILNAHNVVTKKELAERLETNPRDSAEFKKEVEEQFPGQDILVDHLSLSVACHIGPGALAITCTKKLDYNQEPPQL